MLHRNLIFLGVFVVACGSSTDQGDDSGTTTDSGSPQGDSGSQTDGATNPDGGNPGADAGGDSGQTQTGKVIFVVAMENHDETEIIGDMTDAPYINKTLLPLYATTSNFQDPLTHSIPSEPHYVWMEAGTNKFSDTTFTTDSDPSSTNSTKETNHLVTQLQTAGISWMSYQEGITAGTCPVSSIPAKYYAAKHDPFVFFQDVAGKPPASGNANCIAHHKPITSLSDDIKNSTVASYDFVTPSLCNDMHGAGGCPQGTTDAENILAGDTWLKNNLQPMIDYAVAHDGYVFVVWDEGDSTQTMPFIAIGKNVKVKYSGATMYTHSSLLKSEEEILGVTVLPAVSGANDFADLFTQFP
ncbi:MAG TPA: alkaline phosphatase family protein [Polyangiaceae bacterium]